MTKETIKKWLGRHPRLNLTQFLLRKVYPSKEACNDLLRYKEDPLCIQYRHYGDKNPGMVIYHAYVDFGICGYCSLIRFTLIYLAFAERMRFVPIVEWSGKTLYAEKAERVKGVYLYPCDSFEYFFLPVSHIKKDDLLSSDLVVKAKYADINLIVPKMGYYVEEEEVAILAKMWDKYMHFNDAGKEICKKVDALFDGKRMIGVHIRRTDFSQKFNRHPVTVDLSEYMNKVDELFSNDDYDHVFLATDEEDIVEIMKKRFGSKLVYFNDIYRSKDGKPVHYGSGRENRSGFDLAADILKDVLALGRCDGLIAGLSNVSIMARIIKRSSQIDYRDLVILDKGLNKNVKESLFYIKK